MAGSASLDRFVEAQSGGVYEQALSELRGGRKRSHWMWFVFPQLAGLGRSPTARRYAITGLDEAVAYLRHEVLGPRLLECCSALVALPERDPVRLLGSVDATKLRSSMTLFDRAAPAEVAFSEVLAQYFDGEPDDATVRLLGPGR